MPLIHRDHFATVGNRPAIFVAMLALLFVTWNVAPAHAAIENAQFDLQINRELSCLPSSAAACSNNNMFGSQIARQNNMPYVYFKNESLDAAIVEFRMTIGNELFHFGAFGSDFINVAFKPSDLEITSGVALNGNELVLTFGDGLLPGQHVHFQIDLNRDSNPTSGRTSFQTVLFGMSSNGSNGGEKSEVTVTYAMEGMEPLSQGPTAWADQPYNAHINRNYSFYGMSASMNPAMSYQFSATVNNPPDVTDPTDPGGGGDPVIPTLPEPSSGCLAIICLAVAWSTSRCRRRGQRD